jgi:predicted house-cleaning noncanonical NTP pyrophosphatase (MazG superfamily)
MSDVSLNTLYLSEKIVHLIENYILDDNSKTEALAVLLNIVSHLFIKNDFSRARALDIFIFSFDAVSKTLNKNTL